MTAEMDEQTFYCLQCCDEPAAWRPMWCPGSGKHRTFARPETSVGAMSECGRVKAHKPHPYVDRCGCSETNPVIAAHRQRALKRAIEKKGKAAA